MSIKTHKYSNEEITVVWKPDACIHSTLCWKGLREVFDPSLKPWVNVNAATTERIIEQVRKCPSGALSYFVNDIGEQNTGANIVKEEEAVITNIEVTPNGPLIIHSDCKITFADGHEEIRNGITSLCRCGRSSTKPYCDDSHLTNGFKG